MSVPVSDIDYYFVFQLHRFVFLLLICIAAETGCISFLAHYREIKPYKKVSLGSTFIVGIGFVDVHLRVKQRIAQFTLVAILQIYVVVVLIEHDGQFERYGGTQKSLWLKMTTGSDSQKRRTKLRLEHFRFKHSRHCCVPNSYASSVLITLFGQEI